MNKAAQKCIGGFWEEKGTVEATCQHPTGGGKEAIGRKKQGELEQRIRSGVRSFFGGGLSVSLDI